jgi:anti-anti-sigma factor
LQFVSSGTEVLIMDAPTENGSDRLFLAEFHHGILVVVPLGDFETFRWPEMEEASKMIFQFIRNEPAIKILVDMSRLRQCGSALLGIMLRVWKTVSPQHGVLAFCSVNEDVAEILQQTRLDTLWAIYPNREAAFVSMGPVAAKP